MSTERRAREDEIRRLEKIEYWRSYREERLRMARERGAKRAQQARGFQGLISDLNAALERLFTLGELPKEKKPAADAKPTCPRLKPSL
jgi:hypothetical protein